ncbi:tRNA lysidine(34) synthetase TilS [Yimella sp. cx-573]|nr:tRNA lysidine(34) synthetase TilS [Yimella sp. cx-573]
MPGPHPAVAAVRLGIRRALQTQLADTAGSARDSADPRSVPAPSASCARRVVVACSGGADSTALASAVAFEAPRLRVEARAVVVDHQLQPGSDQIAQAAADRLRVLGLKAQVRTVDVGAQDGPEAAARTARYRALRQAASEFGADAILLGHTQDDQAETVLLGLVRGSGTRSLAGMAPVAGDLVRPLLDVTREQTRAACEAQGLEFWDDPHNDDPRYLRVRVRQALADLQDDLGPGLMKGLVRTAELARQDADHLDALATAASERLAGPPWPVDRLAALAPAVRTRWWRQALAVQGAVIADLSFTQVGWLEDLVVRWRGQGPVDVPGGLRVYRADGAVHLTTPGQVE